MPTLLQRAETFVANSTNEVAKGLVSELMARIVELEQRERDAGEVAASVDLALAKSVSSPAAFISAFDRKHRLDAVGTTGGKATVETR